MNELPRNMVGGLCFNNTGNIGDEVQSIAACRLVGEVDSFFDRDRLAEVSAPSGTSYWTILNSWFLSRPESWPPSPSVHPLLISFHLSNTPVYGTNFKPREIVCSDALVDYLNFHGPVGARDQDTCDFLRSRGVDAYFSGCLTLTLRARDVRPEPDLVVLIDVSLEIERYVRARHPDRKFVHKSHTWHESDRVKRFAKAEEMLDLFASAGLVITTRLHCAMPCTGMNVPVILIEDHKDVRFSGLSDFCHTVTSKAFLEGGADALLDTPPASLGKHHDHADSIRARVHRFIEARLTGIRPAAFELTPEKRTLWQHQMNRRYSDIILSQARRLDKLQGVKNF